MEMTQYQKDFVRMLDSMREEHKGEPTCVGIEAEECENNGNYIIAYEMQGAEETFSIGQPVYDKDKNIMGWLGIGLFENLNYSANVRVPCKYWQICLPTKFCKVGKQVYTYWQMTEVEPQESEARNEHNG